MQLHSQPTEWSPLEIILLEEAMLHDTQFCARDHYIEGVCELAGCVVCRDLMLGHEGGTA